MAYTNSSKIPLFIFFFKYSGLVQFFFFSFIYYLTIFFCHIILWIQEINFILLVVNFYAKQ